MKMKLEVSTISGSTGKNPHIRKGYYPGKLTKVEEYKDKDGNWKEGKWGRMLIFTFAVFKADDKGTPIKPMVYIPDDKTPAITKGVEISSFVYHLNKDPKAEGGYRTAITPNSKITVLLKLLGWTFTADGVDPEDLIGNWIELNIDDYDKKDGDETYKASGINGYNKYTGAKTDDLKLGALPKNNSPSTDSTPNKNTTQPDKEKVPEKASSSSDLKDRIDDDVEITTLKPTVEDLENKKKVLTQLKDEGSVSDEAYYQSVEQLDTQIKAIQDGK